MFYTTNIGLEVHIEILTSQKMFCKCSSKFNAQKNINVCPTCQGYPATLPIPNNEAIDLAIKAGISTNCTINNFITFDRKNYFYKDLPKGYQITQFFEPICLNGYITLENGKKITIRQIHIEEDSAKIEKDGTINYNRAGIPLLELVTNPDFKNSDEVIEFLSKLKEILIFCNISDCKMQEGSMRVDINISVSNTNNLGTRIELKNIGSFKSIKNAIAYEQNRQINLLKNNEKIEEETRKFCENTNTTIFMRKKEKISDYKYIKEPDIKEFYIDKQKINNIKQNIPKLPDEIRQIYSSYNLSKNEIDILLSDIHLNNTFNSLITLIDEPKEIAKLICGEYCKILNENNYITIFNHNYVANLISFFLQNKITRDTYKLVFYEIVTNNTEPLKFINDNNLFKLNNTNEIQEIVIETLKKNEKSIIDYKNGKEKAFQYLVGQCMKSLKGKGDINIIKDLLKSNLL